MFSQSVHNVLKGSCSIAVGGGARATTTSSNLKRSFNKNIILAQHLQHPNTSHYHQRRQYHEAVIDHFNNPRNVGKLDGKKSNVGSALVGKASCGDVIKLQIEVDEATNKIKDAKFKTFGCGSAIASSSLATEMVMGQDIDEAAKLKNTDISAHLNLPPVKIHCSVLAEEAIQAAIEDYKRKSGAAQSSKSTTTTSSSASA